MFTDSLNQASVIPRGSRSQLTMCAGVHACVCVCVCALELWTKGGKSQGESSRTCWSILSNYQPIEMWFISQGIISVWKELVIGWEGVHLCVLVWRQIFVELPLTLSHLPVFLNFYSVHPSTAAFQGFPVLPAPPQSLSLNRKSFFWGIFFYI